MSCRAIEIRESVREYVQIYQYRARYATALAEACVCLGRWPRDLDSEVWDHAKTLRDRLAYLRELCRRAT